MPEIIPAIIAKDADELKAKLSAIDGLVSWAHIDIMDGVFTPQPSWRTPAELDDILAAVNLEAHLMVQNPEKIIDAWLASRVRRIFVHYESTTPDTIEGLVRKIQAAGKEAGVVLKLLTPLWTLDFLLEKIPLDSIQLMSIDEIGMHGHPFNEKTLDRIIMLRDKYPDIHISIDGGVTLENAQKIIDAGADRLVAGSAIFKAENVADALERFSKIVSE